MSTPTATPEELLARLSDAGLRATRQRRAIVEVLLAQPAHITAEDLTALINDPNEKHPNKEHPNKEHPNDEHPEVHTATVYRTLEVLESIGVLSRLTNGHAPTQWHLTNRAHQHLVCDQCGRVEEVSSAAFGRLQAALVKDYGFEIDLRHIAVGGVCATCRGGR